VFFIAKRKAFLIKAHDFLFEAIFAFFLSKFAYIIFSSIWLRWLVLINFVNDWKFLMLFRLIVTSFPEAPPPKLWTCSHFRFCFSFPEVERDDGRPRGGALDGHVGHGAAGGRAVGEDEVGEGEGRTRGKQKNHFDVLRCHDSLNIFFCVKDDPFHLWTDKNLLIKS